MKQLTDDAHNLLNSLAIELEKNKNKISPEFVKDYAEACTYEFGKIGNSCRICVLTTTTGSKIIGQALVLDPANGDEEIGNNVAKQDCIEQLWGFLGETATLLG